MKHILVLIAVLLTGCTTVRSAGDLEFLNDVGASEFREAAKTLDHTMNVLGQPRTNQINTSRINTGYGNAKNFQSNDIPSVVAQINDLLRYIK